MHQLRLRHIRVSRRALTVAAVAIVAFAMSGPAKAGSKLFPFFLAPAALQDQAAGPQVRASPICRATWPEGPGNPLGARAMYLGDTVYRIHGTNAPESIGRGASSGCIRLIPPTMMWSTSMRA